MTQVNTIQLTGAAYRLFARLRAEASGEILATRGFARGGTILVRMGLAISEACEGKQILFRLTSRGRKAELSTSSTYSTGRSPMAIAGNVKRMLLEVSRISAPKEEGDSALALTVFGSLVKLAQTLTKRGFMREVAPNHYVITERGEKIAERIRRIEDPSPYARRHFANATRCPRCKCTQQKPCCMKLPDGESEADCVPAGVFGATTCSACIVDPQ